jgi:uncharacterized protein (DUF1778 family)
MPRPPTKTEVLTFRVTAEVRRLVQRAAERERRSLTNMVEQMVYDWCARNGVSDPKKTPGKVR